MSVPEAIRIALARDLLESVAEEMAATCRRTAHSPNIRDRRDLSAAVFDGEGVMVAHAAHIPVHLGAMPLSVREVLRVCRLDPGDVVLTNDPYAGGTHLPDITAVAAVHDPGTLEAVFHVAVRAHHADVGGATPGSMAPQHSIYAEGVRIPPVHWHRGGREVADVTRLLLANVRDADERRADLAAQCGALARGATRLRALAAQERPAGLAALADSGRALVAYAGRAAEAALRPLPDGKASVRLKLGVRDLQGKEAALRVTLAKAGGHLTVDFKGTTGPVPGGLNATRAVVRSAVYYLVRCLCPADTPTNDGLLQPVTLHVPEGSLLDAGPPHPVAGGNVETSQRLVDVLWLAAGKLWSGRIPAPGAGTMSNWTFGAVVGGAAVPSYYETLPGGAGGGPEGPGRDAIQQHMTNTAGTPIEVMERHWPVRVERLRLRRPEAGEGRARGGVGLEKAVRFLVPLRVATLMTRHLEHPPGAEGGRPGAAGGLMLRGAEGEDRSLPAQGTTNVEPGDVLEIRTPGGAAGGELRAARDAPRPMVGDPALASTLRPAGPRHPAGGTRWASVPNIAGCCLRPLWSALCSCSRHWP